MVVTDPAIGLIGNFPIFLVAIVAGVAVLAVRRPRDLVAPEMIIAAVSGIVFLYAFARTPNVSHGGTPGLSRYTLWLIPLAVPLFAALARSSGRTWRRFLMSAAVVSALVCVFAFHPGLPERSREPTWLAAWLWTSHPAWNDPLPEVFSETLRHADETGVPVATAGCEKVLLAKRSGGESMWPIPCYPAATPAYCVGDTLCYANRGGDHYTFARAPGRTERSSTPSGAAWPAGVDPLVRRFYDAWGWASLGPAPEFDVVRAAFDSRVSALGDRTHFIAAIGRTGPNPDVAFRFDSAMTGALFDPRTGSTTPIQAPATTDTLWRLTFPDARDDLLVLAMRRAGIR